MGELKFDAKKSFFIALASFSNCITAPLFKVFMPLLLAQRFENTSQVGALLTISNLFSILFHPLIGNLSDNTQSKFGRRRIYILCGAVLCGAAFVLTSVVKPVWLMALMLTLYNITVAAWRSPVSALMVDCMPPQHVSRTNAMSSAMIGASSTFAYFFSSGISNAGISTSTVFLAGALIMIATALLTCLFVQESDSRGKTAGKPSKRGGLFAMMAPVHKRNFMVMLIVIFLGFTAQTAYEYYFSMYTVYVLRISTGSAALYLGMGTLAFLLFSIVSGLCQQVNHLYLMKAAVIAAISLHILLFWFNSKGIILQRLWLLALICTALGMFWGCFTINALPLLLRSIPAGRAGNSMGYFFVCTGSAMALAPLLFGIVRDMTGSYITLFLFAAILWLAAFFVLLLFNHRDNGSPLSKKSLNSKVVTK
ncbi:MAG: MFS transporter [Bacillota bacterium]